MREWGFKLQWESKVYLSFFKGIVKFMCISYGFLYLLWLLLFKTSPGKEVCMEQYEHCFEDSSFSPFLLSFKLKL